MARKDESILTLLIQYPWWVSVLISGDNTAFGRIQANEATPEEIRAYYAERRAISRDYLELAQLVLAEQGDRLPERDRGLFELSASLHRSRLPQIDRDEADALARLGPR